MFFLTQAATVDFIDELNVYDLAQHDGKPSYVCIEEPRVYAISQLFNTNTVTFGASKDVANNVFEKALYYIQDMSFLEVNEEHDRLVSETVSKITNNNAKRTLDKKAFYDRKYK
ncbi:hypothetical protein A3197_01670 [Candidatus Thiodiazotropha endoloripes]|nr:hypothetical protein A3197_01670 [Candidatus Thiodiazotropha endoloripes]